MSMSGAEFKTILGALGLPPSWFAGKMDVTMRTVVRWFDGDEVSSAVEAEIAELEATTLEMMREVMANTVTSRGGVAMLHTYRTDEEFMGPYFVDDEFNGNMPASWHRQLVFRVMEHLKAQGKTVSVEYK
jgi:hypothetical protein